MPGRKIRDAQDARHLLTELEASDLDTVAFARAHGVDGRSLNAWRLNLARRPRDPRPIRVVELVTSTPSHPHAATMTIRCGAFEVEVGRALDEGLLARVLRVVAAC